MEAKSAVFFSKRHDPPGGAETGNWFPFSRLAAFGIVWVWFVLFLFCSVAIDRVSARMHSTDVLRQNALAQAPRRTLANHKGPSALPITEGFHRLPETPNVNGAFWRSKPV